MPILKFTFLTDFLGMWIIVPPGFCTLGKINLNEAVTKVKQLLKSVWFFVHNVLMVGLQERVNLIPRALPNILSKSVE